MVAKASEISGLAKPLFIVEPRFESALHVQDAVLDLPSPVAFPESEYEQACGQCEPVDRQQYPTAAQEHPAEAQEKGRGSCEEDAESARCVFWMNF